MKNSVHPLLVVIVAVCGARWTLAQPPLPDNTCMTYRKIATDPTATQSGLILSGGPGFTSKVEPPSQTNWVPLCDQKGLYLPLQARQNGQQFCVLPQTGEIAFDPFKMQQAPIKMPIFCACFVARQTVISGHFREFMPACDPTTGLYQLVQMYPNGKLQCFAPDGTTISGQFDPSPSGQLPAECQQGH